MAFSNECISLMDFVYSLCATACSAGLRLDLAAIATLTTSCSIGRHGPYGIGCGRTTGCLAMPSTREPRVRSNAATGAFLPSVMFCSLSRRSSLLFKSKPSPSSKRHEPQPHWSLGLVCIRKPHHPGYISYYRRARTRGRSGSSRHPKRGTCGPNDRSVRCVEPYGMSELKHIHRIRK